MGIIMNASKKIFFLSFLLLTPIIQCMKVEKKNKDEKFKLVSNDTIDLDKTTNFTSVVPDLGLVFFQENHCHVENHLSELEKHRETNINGYSFLGFAAIAIHVYPEDLLQKYPKLAPYEDRKKMVKILLNHGFEPTPQDRELALIVEKQEGINYINGKSDLFD